MKIQMMSWNTESVPCEAIACPLGSVVVSLHHKSYLISAFHWQSHYLTDLDGYQGRRRRKFKYHICVPRGRYRVYPAFKYKEDRTRRKQ